MPFKNSIYGNSIRDIRLFDNWQKEFTLIPDQDISVSGPLI